MARQGVEVELSTKGLSGFKNDMKSAQDSVNNAAGVAKKSGGAFSAVGTALKGIGTIAAGIVASKIFLKIANSLADVAKEGVRMAAAMEVNEMALTNMLGSADEANKLLTEMTKIAIETPFELETMTQGVKQLIAMGVSSKDVIRDISALGDVLSAVGGDSSAMSRMIFNLGQIKSMGRAYWMDIRQFAMAGIPIIEALAESMGVTQESVKDMVAEGTIGYPEVVKALESLTTEGGKFEGMMTQMGQTASGMWANLKDTISITSMEFVEQSGIFDNLVKPALSALLGIVTQIRESLPSLIVGIKSMTETNLWQSFLAWINMVWEGFKVLKEGFVEAYSIVLPFVREALQAVSLLLAELFGESIKDGDEFIMIMRMLGQMIGYTVGAAIIGFAALAMAIIKAVTVTQQLISTIKGSLYSAVSSVKSVFSSIYSYAKYIESRVYSIYLTIGGKLYSAISRVKSMFSSIYSYARSIYSSVYSIYSTVGGRLYSAISRVRSMFSSIYSYARSIYYWVSSISSLGISFGQRNAHGGIAYQSGGVVPGTSYHGDKVNASLNSGEMILNRSQQAALFSYIKNMNRPNVNFSGDVSFGGDRGQMQQESVFTNLLLKAV